MSNVVVWNKVTFSEFSINLARSAHEIDGHSGNFENYLWDRLEDSDPIYPEPMKEFCRSQAIFGFYLPEINKILSDGLSKSQYRRIADFDDYQLFTMAFEYCLIMHLVDKDYEVLPQDVDSLIEYCTFEG